MVVAEVGRALIDRAGVVVVAIAEVLVGAVVVESAGAEAAVAIAIAEVLVEAAVLGSAGLLVALGLVGGFFLGLGATGFTLMTSACRL